MVIYDTDSAINKFTTTVMAALLAYGAAKTAYKLGKEAAIEEIFDRGGYIVMPDKNQK